ncbi:MAG: hypothetical protein E7491_08300 [Ruminococcaceae bacterium]|nr:hypothetical protein [Oscillospiraceae bacterium]
MKLKIIGFNIRCCNDKNGNSVAERAPRLYEVTKPYDADLFGIQEFTPLWEEHFEKYFSADYDIFHKYRDSVGHREGAPILWKKDKFECLKNGYFWLSDTPETESKGWDVSGYKRICEYVVLKEKGSGKEFAFFNTHFGFGDDCQTKSVALIHSVAEQFGDIPMFITGDFNMSPSSVAYGEMVKVFTDVNDATAKDVRPTYHNYAPQEYTGTGYSKGHIDFCFANKNVTPVSHERIDGSVNGKYPSDHYGIYVELDI